MILKLKDILDPIFSKKIEKVESFDEDLKRVVEDIFDTMYTNNAIGLTAVHVGLDKQIAVIDINGDKKNQLVLINPKITWKSEKISESEEGSVSIMNGARVVVSRPDKIKVKYFDLQGNENELEADGLLARCIQHEVEHFDGKTIIDYLDKSDKDYFIQEIQEFNKKLEGAKKMKEIGLKIVYAIDPLIKTVSEPVKEFNEELRSFIDKMFEVMYTSDGIGLAAIQVGLPKRLIVIDVPEYQEVNGKMTVVKNYKYALVNPEILWKSDNMEEAEEGCLSVPEIRVKVVRPDKVKVKFFDGYGKEQIIEADGLLARCLQHEIDHTNGICIIDHQSKLKRDNNIKKLKKICSKK